MTKQLRVDFDFSKPGVVKTTEHWEEMPDVAPEGVCHPEVVRNLAREALQAIDARRLRALSDSVVYGADVKKNGASAKERLTAIEAEADEWREALRTGLHPQKGSV